MSGFWGKEFNDKKFALVLSGGVTKAAAWHLGVTMALEDSGLIFKSEKTKPVELENNAHINTYVGSSAGVLVNLYLVEGYRPHEIINAYIKRSKKLKPITYSDMLSFKRNPKNVQNFEKFDLFENFPFMFRKILSPLSNFSGFFTTTGLAKYLEREVISNSSFEEHAADLFIVATQLDHSRKVIFGKYNYPNPKHDHTACYYTGINMIDAAAASMSVPPFYSPYPILNSFTNQYDYYIDGEIRETLSTHVAIDNKCDIIISSWTHTPYHYHEDIGSLVHYGLPAICVQSIYLLIQKKIMASRARRMMAKETLDTIYNYLLHESFPPQKIKEILSILERKLDYKRNVKLIDIYPHYNDYHTFFANFFSLKASNLSKIVRMGYRRTNEVLKEVDWS